MGKILGFVIGNPLLVIVPMIIGAFAFLYFQNQSLSASNKKMKDEIAVIKEDAKNTEENINRVDAIQQSSANIRNTHTIIRERMNNVEVLGEDRPFVSDPGLLDRARILRDYQRSVQAGSGSTADKR